MDQAEQDFARLIRAEQDKLADRTQGRVTEQQVESVPKREAPVS
jgi:hypothetical protein